MSDAYIPADLLAAPYGEGCPDCGAPDRTSCHGWCPNRHEPPGDDPC